MEIVDRAPIAVLLVDDDPDVREMIHAALERQGQSCTVASNAEEAKVALRERGPFDVMLLDVGMPGRTGFQVLDEMRARGDDTPVIFVTGKQEVDDRVRALDAGADDYIVKPFAQRELLARIEAVVRRRRAFPLLVVADLRLDPGHRTVERAGVRLELSPREFEVLQLLAEARGRTVTKAELLRSAWGMDFDPETTLVEVLVTRLRRKLHAHGPPLLHTERGRGYRLAAVDAQAD